MNSSQKYRKKIVIVLSRFPFPLEKGDKLRAYHQIKELSKDFEIVVICLSDKKINKESIQEIRPFVKEIHLFYLNKISIVFNLFLRLFSSLPFQTGYFYSSKIYHNVQQILKAYQPDHIYCQLIRVSELVKNYHGCPKTLDYMDALSKGIERRIEKVSPWIRWVFRIEASRLTNYERKIFDYFEYHTMISEQDRQFIMHPNKDKIVVIPNGVDTTYFRESISKNQNYDIVFVGNMSYPPNIHAVEYIVDEILPCLPKDTTVLIAGANPTQQVKKLASNTITISGWMEDIREAYQSGQMFVAPMFIGTGMQNKLLEAMASTLPCITTTLANNAIGAIHQKEIIVADSKEEIINAILQLKADSDKAKKIGQAGSNLVENLYSWKTTTDIIKTWI